MYRTRLEVDPEPLVDAARFVSKFDKMVEGTAQQTFDEMQPAFLEELQTYPGESKNARNSGEPFRWSDNPQADARGRAGYFARHPNGSERTGELGRGWTVELKRVGKALHLLASNPVPYLKWAMGTFDLRRRWQIPGHARTGWRLVRTITDSFFDRYYAEFRKRFDEAVPRAWGTTTSRRRNR